MTKIDADELYSLSLLGHALLERGKLDDAQRLFAGLTTLAPDAWYGYMALGRIARQRGDAARAVDYMNYAASLAPASAQPELVLAAAEAHILNAQRAEARAALARVIQLPDASSAQTKRARALLTRLNSR